MSEFVTDMTQVDLKLVKMPPTDFITGNDILSEVLSVINLSAKSTRDYILNEDANDTCMKHKNKTDCEQLDPACNPEKNKDRKDRVERGRFCVPKCNMINYKERAMCVNPNRINYFRERSAELGNRLEGKFRHQDDKTRFIIIKSVVLKTSTGTTVLKYCISSKTSNLYVVFNNGLVDANFDDYDLPNIVNEIIKFTESEKTKIILCGHSMGAVLALICGHLMRQTRPDFFSERCSIIAMAPYRGLPDDSMNNLPNVTIYVSAIMINGHLYVDPFYYKGREMQYSPVNLLILDGEIVYETVVNKIDDKQNAGWNVSDILLNPLHSLTWYLNYFYFIFTSSNASKWQESIKQKVTGGRTYRHRSRNSEMIVARTRNVSGKF